MVMGLKNEKPYIYICKPVYDKLSAFLLKEPEKVRKEECYEEGWFNRKESYVRKRMKYDRKKGQYVFAISDAYRSYNGSRITKYTKYWLTERDIYFINSQKEMPNLEEQIPVNEIKKIYESFYLE